MNDPESNAAISWACARDLGEDARIGLLRQLVLRRRQKSLDLRPTGMSRTDSQALSRSRFATALLTFALKAPAAPVRGDHEDDDFARALREQRV